MKNVYKIAFLGLITPISTYVFADDTVEPSYQMGVSAEYTPSIDSKNFSLAAKAGMSIPFGKTRFNVGISANRLLTSPIDESDDVEKISDYQQTKLNFSISQPITKKVNVTLFTDNPIHYNEKKFGKKQKSISFGGAVTFGDEEGFNVSINASKVNYKKPDEGYSYGDIVAGGITFGWDITSTSELSLGATYQKQKPTLFFKDKVGQKVNKKTTGLGATLGVDLALDNKRKHNIGFNINSGIGDIGGSVGSNYTYRF